MYGGCVVADERDVPIFQVGADGFHNEPQEEETCHFQVGVGDRTGGVRRGDNRIGNMLWPFEAKYRGQNC